MAACAGAGGSGGGGGKDDWYRKAPVGTVDIDDDDDEEEEEDEKERDRQVAESEEFLRWCSACRKHGYLRKGACANWQCVINLCSKHV
jgi:hypothetical protein